VTNLLLTRNTVVDLLLLGLDPSVPLGYLLVDTAAYPGRRDIFEITRYSFVPIISSINLPGLGAGTIARKYRPIVQILERLALQDHGLAVHLYLL